MRKAGLLDKKPLTATRKMLETAKNDTGTEKKSFRCYSGTYHYMEYESRYYFRAMVSANNRILEIDLFTRRDLASGRTDPRFRIFLDRENRDFASWDVVNGKWSSAKIDMLVTDDDRYSYSYRGRNYAARETLDTVNGYLDTGCMKDVETAVLDFQTRIRKTKLTRKHKLITDAIDSYMSMVPDRLPADWMKFINDRVLEHSVFYIRGANAGYCTHCRLHVPVPSDARHNMRGKCRQCGCSITYKSWKKQKHTTYRTTAAVLQKCADGVHYVYRQFRVDMYTEREKHYKPEIAAHEDYRVLFILADGHNIAGSMRSYEWGEFRHTGIERWCEDGTVNHGGYYSGNYGYARSVLYTGNIKKILKETRLQYVPAAEIVKSMGSERINVVWMLDDMESGFPYEVFWKMGLRRFIQERIRRESGKGQTKIDRTKAKPKLWDFLGITREDMKQAIRLDATDQQMRIIQKAAGLGVSLTDEQVEWFDRYMGIHAVLDYINMQTPHRIIRYLQENTEVGSGDLKKDTLLHFWTDYLNMALQLGWNLRDRSVFFPQNIKRAHDETTVAFTIWKDNEDAKKMQEQDMIMGRNAEEIRKAFTYRDSQYMIIVPGCYLDFKHEGNAQHNCVATYYDMAVKGECIILFLRRQEAPNEAFCTVEIQNNGGKFALIQNRAAYNHDAPKDAKEFMKKAVKEAQKIADKMAAEESRKLRQRVEG